jgi:hypothetical protein
MFDSWLYNLCDIFWLPIENKTCHIQLYSKTTSNTVVTGSPYISVYKLVTLNYRLIVWTHNELELSGLYGLVIMNSY